MIVSITALIPAIVGAAFLLLAGVGILRLPDLYCRASATTKAATLGVGCVLLSAALHFDDLAIKTRVAATIAFLLLTAPVAAHMIARAAYLRGVPFWSGTTRDELAGERFMDAKRAQESGVDEPFGAGGAFAQNDG